MSGYRQNTQFDPYAFVGICRHFVKIISNEIDNRRTDISLTLFSDHAIIRPCRTIPNSNFETQIIVEISTWQGVIHYIDSNSLWLKLTIFSVGSGSTCTFSILYSKITKNQKLNKLTTDETIDLGICDIHHDNNWYAYIREYIICSRY